MWMTLVAFLMGLIVGAVVNQLGTDLLRRDGLSEPHCPYCGQSRTWWQWIGVAAYLVGRGECVSCGATMRLRRPLVEVGMGFVYGYVWLAYGPSVKLVFYGLYSAVLALVLVTDLERRLILDVVTYPGIALGLLGSLFVPDVTWWSALIGGGIGLAFFYVAAVVGRVAFGAGALGGGDVKLAAFVGVITGYPLVIEAIVVTILAGALVSSILLITGARGLRDHVPYGPFLVAGALVTLLWGYDIAGWALF